MFWHKKQIQSEEYLKLYSEIEKLRIKVEMMELSLDLTKKKLKIKKGIIEQEEEMGESETNKNPSIFLSPNGATIRNT